MKKVLITSSIHSQGTELLKEKYEVIVAPDENKETLMGLCKDADAIISRLAIIDADIIEAAPNLRVIAQHGAGVNNIDVKKATEKGIYVLNTGDANSLSVAEHTIAAMLAVFKRVTIIDKALRNGNWFIKNDNKSLNFTGKTIGLVGIGSIGSEVARMAKYGFLMNVIAYDPYANKEKAKEKGIEIIDDLQEMFRTADVISIHSPLTPETRGFIDEKLLSLMKPSAIFVNFARGEIVDEDYLYEMLKDNKIFGAALDAFSQEPLPNDSKFYGLENLIVSPHGSTFTMDCRAKMSVYLAEDIIRYFEGTEPIRIVNRELKK